MKTARELKDLGLTDLTINAVYVSPARRTQQTAEIIMNELEISKEKKQINELLVDISFGEYEGKHFSIFQKEANDDFWEHFKASEYGGETSLQVRERVKTFIGQLAANFSETNKENNILIITHGSPAKELVAVLDGKEGIVSDPKLDPASYIVKSIPHPQAFDGTQKFFKKKILILWIFK